MVPVVEWFDYTVMIIWTKWLCLWGDCNDDNADVRPKLLAFNLNFVRRIWMEMAILIVL